MTRDDAVPPPATCCCRPSRAWSDRCSSSTTTGGSVHQPRRGARARPARSTALVGRVIWEEYPEALGSPFEELYRRVGEHGTGQHRGLVRPARRLVPGGCLPHRRRPRRHLRRRHAATPHRGGARGGRRRPRGAAARPRNGPRRGGGGRSHLMLLGDINLAMTSTSDTDEAVQRFAELVVPLLADWCLVTVDANGTRRDVGRHTGPRPGRGDAPLRRPAGRANNVRPPPCRALRDPAGGHPGAHRGRRRHGAPRGRRGAGALRPPPPPRSRSSPAASSSAASPWSTGPSAGRTPRPSSDGGDRLRRAALALDNARLAAANQQVAERLQLSLLSPPVQPDQWSSPSATGRRPRGCRSAGTGTTPSCSPTATPCWSSAT